MLPARALALEWLGSLARMPDLAQAREAVTAAPDVPLLRAVLRRHLAGPLNSATRAALEGGVVVAISPSPALDGVLAGLRGLSLLQQVAAIHGMRPCRHDPLGIEQVGDLAIHPALGVQFSYASLQLLRTHAFRVGPHTPSSARWGSG